jgi:hypothetical protein
MVRNFLVFLYVFSFVMDYFPGRLLASIVVVLTLVNDFLSRRGKGVTRGIRGQQGQFKVDAVLKAVASDGTLHLRPLCTSGDIVLALHELCDPSIFAYGCVQLPHIIADNWKRDKIGVYKYEFMLNKPGRWFLYK